MCVVRCGTSVEGSFPLSCALLDSIFTPTEVCYGRTCRPDWPLPNYNLLFRQCVDMGLRRHTYGNFCSLWRQGRFHLTPRPFSQSNSQIHVDRYKHCIYSHLSHGGLSKIITRDMSSTRFHACERFDRCEAVERVGKSLVYVNPVPMGSEDWGGYLDATKEKLKYGEEVTSLVRCSTLSVLRLFSPFQVSSTLCGGTRHSLSCKRS
jgi:hypothetical protein